MRKILSKRRFARLSDLTVRLSALIAARFFGRLGGSVAAQLVRLSSAPLRCGTVQRHLSSTPLRYGSSRRHTGRLGAGIDHIADGHIFGAAHSAHRRGGAAFALREPLFALRILGLRPPKIRNKKDCKILANLASAFTLRSETALKVALFLR